MAALGFVDGLLAADPVEDRALRLALCTLFFTLLHTACEFGPGARAIRAWLTRNGVGQDGKYYLEFEEVGAALKKDDSRGSSSGQEGQRRVSEGSEKALDMAVHDCATRITTAVHNAVVTLAVTLVAVVTFAVTLVAVVTLAVTLVTEV